MRLSKSAEPVVEWRARRLRAAGLDGQRSRAVAEDTGYDIHALLDLVDRGCPAELAARIVAPNDSRGER